MKKYTRRINHFDEWTQSWFAVDITEYPFIESLCQNIAHILPKKIVYYCYVRFLAFATTHGEGENISPDNMSYSKAVEIWESYNH